jgi:hypothetical protein
MLWSGCGRAEAERFGWLSTRFPMPMDRRNREHVRRDGSHLPSSPAFLCSGRAARAWGRRRCVHHGRKHHRHAHKRWCRAGRSHGLGHGQRRRRAGLKLPGPRENRCRAGTGPGGFGMGTNLLARAVRLLAGWHCSSGRAVRLETDRFSTHVLLSRRPAWLRSGAASSRGHLSRVGAPSEGPSWWVGGLQRRRPAHGHLLAARPGRLAPATSSSLPAHLLVRYRGVRDRRAGCPVNWSVFLPTGLAADFAALHLVAPAGLGQPSSPAGGDVTWTGVRRTFLCRRDAGPSYALSPHRHLRTLAARPRSCALPCHRRHEQLASSVHLPLSAHRRPSAHPPRRSYARNGRGTSSRLSGPAASRSHDRFPGPYDPAYLRSLPDPPGRAKTRATATARVSHRLSRRRPTLPGGCPPSTIGAGGLNFRVRDGNGCGPTAMVTGNLALFCGSHSWLFLLERSIASTSRDLLPKPSAD